MELTFTTDQRALRAEVAAFLDEERAAGTFTPFQESDLVTNMDRSGDEWCTADSKDRFGAASQNSVSDRDRRRRAARRQEN